MAQSFLDKVGPQILKCWPNYNSADGSWACFSSLKDLRLILVLSMVVILVRVVLYTNVFPAITSKAKLPARVRTKCHDDMWFFLAHLLTFSCGAYTISKESYAMAALGSRDALRLCWRSYPAQHVFLKLETRLYYVLAAAVWFHNLIDLLLERAFGFRYIYYIATMLQIPVSDKCLEFMPSKSHRSDFLSMILHHIVTSSLLLLSYYGAFTRIGHVILVVSDVSDILLCITKVLFRLGKRVTSNVFFVLFALSWVYTRHYVYFNTLISNTFDSVNELVDTCSSWDPNGHECTVGLLIYVLSVSGFAILQALFIRWFTLILKTIYYSLRSEYRDVLSEGDSTEVISPEDLEDAVQPSIPDSKNDVYESALMSDSIHHHQGTSVSAAA